VSPESIFGDCSTNGLVVGSLVGEEKESIITSSNAKLTFLFVFSLYNLQFILTLTFEDLVVRVERVLSHFTQVW